MAFSVRITSVFVPCNVSAPPTPSKSFVFTEPEYLGHHFTFNDDRFSIVHHHDEIKWKGFRTFGAALGNTQAVAKLKLASLPT